MNKRSALITIKLFDSIKAIGLYYCKLYGFSCRLFVISLILFLSSCMATLPHGSGVHESFEGKFSVPFLYHGLGAGAQPMLGIVQLNEGDER